MQLSSYENLNKVNIIFKEAKEFQVKDSKIKYKRIPIEIKYSNVKKGPLVIETPILFSFGITEKKNQDTKKLAGYSIPVCLWAKDSKPNNKEKAFWEVINKVTTLSQKYLEKEYGPDLASSLTSPLFTNRKNTLIKKERRKQELTPHPHQFFMRNLFTQKNQIKFYLCSGEREVKI